MVTVSSKECCKVIKKMKFIGKIIWFLSKAIMHIAHIYEKSLYASSGKELSYHGGNLSFSNNKYI